MHTVDASTILDLAGTDLGTSDPIAIAQEAVDAFADATGDHQWIHVDPVRAAASPFGGTIAHGYMTLALVPRVLGQLVAFEGFRTVINYGCNRVRFTSPVPTGSSLVGTAVVEEVTEVGGGFQLRIGVTLTVEGADRPACVAEILLRQLV